MKSQPSDFERALRPLHRDLYPGEAAHLQAAARLEFWRAPLPQDIFEREMESARRRFILGNLSGLWDALARCSTVAPVHSWSLPVPEWLAEALAAVVRAHAPEMDHARLEAELRATIGAPISKSLFGSLDSIVRRYLRGVRVAKTGRYTYWCRRWVGDLIDFERYDYMQHLLVDVQEESREELESLARHPTSPQIEEHRQWRQFVLYWSRWTDDRAAAMVAAELNSPSFPLLRAQTVLESRKRVLRNEQSEPWRYTIGPLAHLELTRRDEIRRKERGTDFEISRLTAAFELWKAEEGTRRRVSRSR